jgi:hypothetical protein
MNTPLYPPLKYPNLFRGTFYNRRRSSLPARMKPLISKLPGTETWFCRYRWVPGMTDRVGGFGLTPTAAYKDWKHRMTEQC